jgi:hypothetical protein
MIRAGRSNAELQAPSMQPAAQTDAAKEVALPGRMYDDAQPDALDLPWDSEAAGRIIPYSW